MRRSRLNQTICSAAIHCNGKNQVLVDLELQQASIHCHFHDIGKAGFHRVAETHHIQTARHQRGSEETNHLQAEHAALGSKQITSVPGFEQGEQPASTDGGQAAGIGIARPPNTKQKAGTSGLHKAEHQGEAGIHAHPQ